MSVTIYLIGVGVVEYLNNSHQQMRNEIRDVKKEIERCAMCFSKLERDIQKHSDDINDVKKKKSWLDRFS